MKQIKNFQVNTFGIPEVKNMLVILFKKLVKQDVSFGCYEAFDLRYLLFNFETINVFHSGDVYMKEEYEVVSLEYAIKIMTESKIIKVELNDNYSAEVSKNGVKIYGQTFP